MNKAVVSLAVLSAVLVVALFLQRSDLHNRLASAATGFASLSNKLVEAEIKVSHQERLGQSLGANLTDRTDELARRAAELAETRRLLGQSQAGARAAQTQLESALAAVRELRVETEALSNQLETTRLGLEKKDAELLSVRDQLSAAESRSRTRLQAIADLKEQQERLNYQLNTPEFLRAQLATLARQAGARKDTNGSPDFRFPVELLPDGSARIIPADTNVAARK